MDTGTPSMAVMRSPGCRPATSAGLLGVTSAIFQAVSRWSPKNPMTATSSTRAMRKCMAEPATATDRPRPVALLAVGAGLVLGRHLLEVVHADDAHVGAGGDGLHAVLRLAPPERPDAGPEAQEELGDLHAGSPGHEEVAQLVEEDAHDERHHDEEGPPRTEDADGQEQADHDGQGRCGRLARRRLGRRRRAARWAWWRSGFGCSRSVTSGSSPWRSRRWPRRAPAHRRRSQRRRRRPRLHHAGKGPLRGRRGWPTRRSLGRGRRRPPPRWRR